MRNVVLSSNDLFPIKVFFGQVPTKSYVTQINFPTIEKYLLSQNLNILKQIS